MELFEFVARCIVTLGVVAVIGILVRACISCVRDEGDWYGVFVLTWVIILFAGAGVYLWLL